MSILIDQSTRILVQGITGREAVAIVQASIDYGARIVAGVTPGKGGQEIFDVPVYDSVAEALRHSPCEATLISVPPPFLRDAAAEAILAGIPLLVITTEKAPRRDVAEILELARERNIRVVGPNSMGVILPGKSKLGSVGGPSADARRSYQPGSVGIMSRSGGMMTEIASMLTQSGIGQSTCVSVGGDSLVGSTFTELYPLFEADPETDVIVIYGEPGGSMEQDLAEHLVATLSRTPVVAFLAGQFMDQMQGVRFGHAGTIVERAGDSALVKAHLLREAGALVADHLSEVPGLVREALARNGWRGGR